MNNDIAVMINNIKLNVRVGIIFKYQDLVLIEIPRINFNNSVIPGGRMKIGEYSKDTIKREIKEEMNFDLEESKIKLITTIEGMFTFDNIDYHEIFFVYKYEVDENDYQSLSKIKENCDSHNSDYKFITKDDFVKYNLLPFELRDIINNIK